MMLKPASNLIIGKLIKLKATAALLSAIALILIVWSFYNIFSINMSNSVYEQVIEYERLNIQAVVRARALGMGGNSEISVFEHDKRDANNPLGRKLLTFKGVMDLYYKKQDESTLVIYVPSEGVALNQRIECSKLRIVINELKNHDELRKYESNYKQYGLSKISIYEER